MAISFHRLCLLLLATLMLSACDVFDDDDNPAVTVDAAPAPSPAPPATQSIAVTPSLGSIVGGSVTASTVDGATLTESAVTTGTDGTAVIEIPENHNSPLLITVSGADDATYYDEALRTTVPFPSDASLRAFLEAPRATVGVHPLTEMAVSIIEASGATIDAALIAGVNESVRISLAPGVTDLLAAPTLADANIAAGTLDDSDAGRLAAYLAGLAGLAPAEATPAVTVMQQLAADLSDGTIDGANANGAIEALVYEVNSFAATYLEQVRSFVAAFGTDDLQSALADITAIGNPGLPGDNGTDGGDDGDAGDGDAGGDAPLGATEPATLNADLAGTYALSYAQSVLGGPFEDGEQVSAIVGTDGSLEIAGVVLTEPFYRVFGGSPNTAEVIWFDASGNIEYSLTDNTSGQFNEINLGDTTQPVPISDTEMPTFLGQLRLAEDGGDGGDSGDVPLVAVGDGAALDGQDGATGTFNGTASTYTDSAAFLVGVDGNVVLTAIGPTSIDQWRVSGFGNAAGTYECGAPGDLPSVQLTIGGVPYLSLRCTIEVTDINSTTVEGRFAAELANASGDVAGTVTDGYFRVTPDNDTSEDGTIPAGEFGVTLEANGELLSAIGDVAAIAITGTGDSRYLELGTVGGGIARLRLIPIGTPGTYTCGEGPNSFRLVEAFVAGGTANASTEGSSCTIVVSKAGDIYEGTFEGTFIDENGNQIIVTNGFFRNDGSSL